MALLISLRKTVGKASLILVTLTSSSDSDVESSNVSLKENNLMALIQTLTISTTTFERMKEKFYGRQEKSMILGSLQVHQSVRKVSCWYKSIS